MRRAAGVTALLLALLPAGTVLLSSLPAAAQETATEPDLAEVALRVDDLPAGFGETADLFTIGGLITELLRRAPGAAVHQHRVFADDAGTEVIESLLIGPLASPEQGEFDAWFADGEDMVQTVADAVPPFGTAGTWAVLDTAGLGDSSFACWMTATEEKVRDRAAVTGNRARETAEAVARAAARQAGSPTRLEVALARRGTYLLAVAITHDGAGSPIADTLALARLLDGRLAEALGLPAGGFRPPGLLVPDLTTHIPTPTDISTDPAVVGTNLLLAGLAMLAFVVADVVLDSTVAESESRLQRAVLPARWLGRLQQRLDAALAARLSRGSWPDRVRLAGVVGIYGLVFSFLEPGWHPFSVTGLYLFLTMAVSFGVIGHLSGMAKWAAARRLQVPAELGLRPANLLLAAASLGFSRAFSLTPGLMIGRPVSYQIDEDALDPPRRIRLLGVGAFALAGVAAAAWLLTIPTSLLQRADLPGWLQNAVGGIEAFLLVMFAVALQNLFRETLALPRSAGRFLSRRHRLFWVAALLGISFAFWHTLINPDGNLAATVKSRNVRFFLAVVGAFVLFTICVWGYARLSKRRLTAIGEAPGGTTTDGAAPGSSDEPPPGASPAAGWQPDPTGRHQHRYWDGSRWTNWVADGGTVERDPPSGS
jgi:hypothetical protein